MVGGPGGEAAREAALGASLHKHLSESCAVEVAGRLDALRHGSWTRGCHGDGTCIPTMGRPAALCSTV
jgi:hypothetical protein